jgi:phosphopantothenoylcysteine decarboxylase/phosphopantothenate--cysteine ligase
MYENRIVQQNLRRLVDTGFRTVGPESGALACGYTGLGRLSDPEVIAEEIRVLMSPDDLAGERLLVTAGPNREAIDPVRFLSNRSTGRMGYAVARVARRRGAHVTLVTGPTALVPPPGVTVVDAVSAEDMYREVMRVFPRATGVVMAAAVADYRPARTLRQKLKKGKGPISLGLTRNRDILAALGKRRGDRLLIGFAAETDRVEANAARKLREKNIDLIVANNVRARDAGFEAETNRVHFLDRKGWHRRLPLLSKEEVAERICSWISQQRRRTRRVTRKKN